MKRCLNFVGKLSTTDYNELKKSGADFKHDNDWTSCSGLNGLMERLDQSPHISSNATNVYDPIYVVRPNKNSAHYLLEILAEFHKGEKSVSVYYDDFSEDGSPQQSTDYEKSMKTLQDQGIKVYRSVSEVREALSPLD